MGPLSDYFPELNGFEWDGGNADKNWHGHAVSQSEAEQVFLNRLLVLPPDTKHSQIEVRQVALGQTGLGRPLAVVFTTRPPRLRIISARPMNRRERKIYDEKAKAAQGDSGV